MKIVQYGKSGKRKKKTTCKNCDITKLQYERMQHEKLTAWK